MNISTLRTISSLAIASLSFVGLATNAQASVLYADRELAASPFTSLIDAEFTPDGSTVLVLSHSNNVGTLSAVNPATNAVTDSVTFNQATTGDDVDWTSAIDLVVTADSDDAYVAFGDSSRVIARVDASTLDVVSYITVPTFGESSEPLEALALLESDTELAVFSTIGKVTYNSTTLAETSGGYSSVNVEDTVTNKGVAFDPVRNVVIWADRTDWQIGGAGRVNHLGSNEILYAEYFGTNTTFSAVAMDRANVDLIVATNRGSGNNQLIRATSYDVNYMPNYETVTLDRSLGGVIQLVTSTTGNQLVALTANDKLYRMPLGRGWRSSFGESIDIKIAAGLNSSQYTGSSAIAISPDGSQLVVVNQSGWVVSFEIENAVSTVPAKPGKPNVDLNRRSATLSWSEPWDNGGEEISGYTVQCKVVGARNWTEVEINEPSVMELDVARARKATVCRVIANNEVGPSTPSATATIRKSA